MRVGVVPAGADRARAAVEDAGGVVAESGVDAVVAAGVDALSRAIDGAAGETPVLVVDADADGLPTVRPAELQSAVAALVAGERVPTVSHPLLVARTGDERVRATLDVSLLAVEPGRISEFDIEAGVEGERGRLARLRADGVVVATPAGSHGYAHAAGGPRIVGGAVAVVVPVGPFTVDPDTWVTPLSEESIRLTVARDEAPVGLFADGTEVCSVTPGEPVTVGHGGDLRLVDGRRL